MTKASAPTGNAIAITVAVLILLLFGIGTAVSYGNEQSLRSQLEELVYVPQYDAYGMPVPVTEERRAWAAEDQSLRSQMFEAEHTTETWTKLLFGYVVISVLIIAMLVVAMAIRDSIKELGRRAAERKTANSEPLISKIASAAGAVSKAIPRQPIIAGGGLSTADELRKWSQLRDEGMVTEEEFQKMREKLVG